MLYLVLGLVLAAFGLLIAALTTANTLFAWISVTVSVIAAGLLVLDWIRGRRRAAEAADAAEPDPVMERPERPFSDQTPPLTETVRGGSPPVEPAGGGRTEPPPGGEQRAGTEPPATVFVGRSGELDHPTQPPPERPTEPPAELPAELPAERVNEPAERPVAQEPGEPGEEDTDAADLLVVNDLRVEVRVVDEHPRYHLASCTYLLDKPTLPLPVFEARELGFTPCARCGPDATLAAQHRATR